jgi:hypothetical protein
MSAFIKGAQETLSLAFYHVRIQEADSLQPRGGPLPGLDYTGTLIADFQAPEVSGINFCC